MNEAGELLDQVLFLDEDHETAERIRIALADPETDWQEIEDELKAAAQPSQAVRTYTFRFVDPDTLRAELIDLLGGDSSHEIVMLHGRIIELKSYPESQTMIAVTERDLTLEMLEHMIKHLDQPRDDQEKFAEQVAKATEAIHIAPVVFAIADAAPHFNGENLPSTITLHHIFTDLSGPFVQQRMVSLAADLIRFGFVDEATTLAQALVNTVPEYAVGQDLLATLKDESLDHAARKDAVDQLLVRCEQQIGQALAIQELQRRVDQQLLIAAMNAQQPEVDREDEGDDGESADPKDAVAEPVALRLLVASMSDDTLDDLRQAGLTVDDSVDGANLIVGRASLADLPTIALHRAVRRVEPVE